MPRSESWYSIYIDNQCYRADIVDGKLHFWSYTLEKFRDQLGLLTSRLDEHFIYRLAKKYMLVEEHIQKIPVQFYFEWLKEMGCD